MYQNNDDEESGNFDSFNQWHKDEGMQVIKRPRNDYQNKKCVTMQKKMITCQI